MGRYQGRVIVSKVDEDGNRIRDLKSWIQKNPKKLYFDSYPEWEVWNYINKQGINHKYQVTLQLFDSITTQEFKQPRQTKKAKEEKRNLREIKPIKQEAISYTPDFYLPDFAVYVEVKGFADEVFKLRWKLFKLKGHKGFVVYSLDEFKKLYKQLQEQ